MSIDQAYEILHDETIELLDENKENILLRILRISYQNEKCVETMLFDSKERIYMTITHSNIDISSFYYSSDLTLRYNHNGSFGWPAYQLTDNSLVHLAKHCGSIKLMIIRHFYENRNEYCPHYGLSNFELK